MKGGYREKILVETVESQGHIVIFRPRTIFVPAGIEEEELSSEIKEMRDKFEYMVQTEIR